MSLPATASARSCLCRLRFRFGRAGRARAQPGRTREEARAGKQQIGEQRDLLMRKLGCGGGVRRGVASAQGTGFASALEADAERRTVVGCHLGAPPWLGCEKGYTLPINQNATLGLQLACVAFGAGDESRTREPSAWEADALPTELLPRASDSIHPSPANVRNRGRARSCADGRLRI